MLNLDLELTDQNFDSPVTVNAGGLQINVAITWASIFAFEDSDQIAAMLFCQDKSATVYPLAHWQSGNARENLWDNRTKQD